MHWEAKKLCDWFFTVIFALLWWSKTEPGISPRYVCILKRILEMEKYLIFRGILVYFLQFCVNWSIGFYIQVQLDCIIHTRVVSLG